MNTQIIIATIIAFLVAWIARQQWRTNRDRLRHELFDKRISVYDTIAEFLARVGRSGKVEKGADLEFLFDTRRAYFVFGCDEEIKQLVSQIFDHAADLECHGTESKGLDGPALKESLRKERAAKEWLSNALNTLEGRFEKYLKLTH